jgi:hypothetical protein
MVVVLVAGIYGVVSLALASYRGNEADCQVYGPIEAQVKVENIDPESRPLLEDRDVDVGPDAATYHGV